MSERIATAEWSNPEEFAKNHQFKTGDFWLGRSLTPDCPALGHGDDRHICLVSGSRGGKGTTSIINNLCLWPGSAVVIDPKGENATVTARRRGAGSEYCEGMGQKVLVLDPFNTAELPNELKGSFNPLDALSPDKPSCVSEAGKIAETLVLVQNKNEPFWEQQARSMLHALILHVLTDPKYDGEKNLLTVRRLIMRGDWKAVKVLQEDGHEKIPPAQHLLWNAVRLNEAFDVLTDAGSRILDMAIHAAEQFEGVIAAAADALRFLEEPEMRKCAEFSTFKLSDLKTAKEGMTLYLCLPQNQMNSHSGWLRMMIALTLYEMQTLKGRPATGHKVLVCLDEFAGLKRMDVIEDNIAQIAGFGVKLFVVLQSLAQLKGTYEKTWENFLGNCGVKIFFDIEDNTSRDYVSKQIGETEVIRETNTSNKSTTDSESTTVGESRSLTIGESESKSASVSRNKSISDSRSTSKNWGGNSNYGWSSGDSQSENWGVHPLIFRNTSRFFSLFRQNETVNQGVNRSNSGGGGKSWGGGVSDTRGTSESIGESISITKGTSRSETYGTNNSTTKGRSEAVSQGTNETILKRALLTPDEIGRYFSRIDDSNDPRYPGFALVLISGQGPLPTRRSNYYQDFELQCLFDPHPQHPETAPEKLIVQKQIIAPPREILDALKSNPRTALEIEHWLRSTGDRVSEGETLFNVGNLKRIAELLPESITAKSPFNGILSSISHAKGPFSEGQILGEVAVNRLHEIRRLKSNPPTGQFDFLGFDEYAQKVTRYERELAESEERRRQDEARRRAEAEAAARKTREEFLAKKAKDRADCDRMPLAYKVVIILGVAAFILPTVWSSISYETFPQWTRWLMFPGLFTGLFTGFLSGFRYHKKLAQWKKDYGEN